MYEEIILEPWFNNVEIKDLNVDKKIVLQYVFLVMNNFKRNLHIYLLLFYLSRGYNP